MSMDILVTGATGHVGNELIRTLNEQGKKVRALIFPGEDTASLRNLDVERVEGDILEPGTLRDAVKGIKYVYHLASLISIGGISEDLVRRVNIQGTRNVALACRESHVKRLVYVSSIHALVRPEEGEIIDERLPFDADNPAGVYDRSKAEASIEVQELVKTGLDAVIVCPTGIVGPHDFRRSEMGRMITDWMQKKLHWMVEGHFDFVDVRDIVSGLISACLNGKKGETYILSGERNRLADIRHMVQEEAFVQSPQIMVPQKLALFGTKVIYPLQKLFRTASGFTPYSIETVMSNSHISSEKAQRELGFSPRPFRETIGDIVSWWKENWALVENPHWFGKVALITGASSGIGAASARKMASLGFEVLLVARREDKLQHLTEEIRESGGRADYIALDLTDPLAVDRIRKRIETNYHGIDVLINNAGIGWYGYFADMGWETADTMMTLNTSSLVKLSLFVLPLMRKRRIGRIINIGSIAGEIEGQGSALYSATKSFLNTFTRAISRELKGSKIKMSVLRPGPVSSEFFDSALEKSNGRKMPVSSKGIKPALVAERIWRLVKHPRHTAYVPGTFGLLKFTVLVRGWILDIAGPIHLKRHAKAKL
ncbi:MAG: SDR family NAD(P)-dependent oxidoreductase [Spirochaetales bacterium]|nr:SDR family NAD(P)-dependent oxidoreductase [Spirochaetales bacterium]